MSGPRIQIWFLILLLVVCFALACPLQSRFVAWPGSRANGDVFAITLGESRKLFANEFFVKADSYYHSGFYPTIFDDNRAFKTAHMAEDTGAVNSQNHGEEESFMGPPRNWIDAFGRHFMPDRHTHLDEGGASGDLSGSEGVREILPWLKLSADLDPQNVQNYIVTAYWLRQRMHQPKTAQEVLLEGLHENPGSCDILFELGRLYAESDHDTNRAVNVWMAGLHNWRPVKGTEDEVAANNFIYEKLATQMGAAQADVGNWQAAIQWFEKAKAVSKTPDGLQQMIELLQQHHSIKPKP